MITNIKHVFLLISVVMLLYGCTKTCTDPSAYTFDSGTGAIISINPQSNQALCMYTKVVWYMPVNDTVYIHYGTTVFPLIIYLDGNAIDTIKGPASVPGGLICEKPQLTDSTFVVYSLPDGNWHVWYTASPNAKYVYYSDSIHATYSDTCISIKL